MAKEKSFCNVDYNWIVHDRTHLNDGIGIPCAGHIKASCSNCLCLNDPKVSEAVENLGLAEPTGSGSLMEEQITLKATLVGT
jgi:hypothetical protein